MNPAQNLGKSLIKPHFQHLSGSGNTLDGLIVERNLENPEKESYAKPGSPPGNIVVIHGGQPASLRWKFNGADKKSVFEGGEAILNPMGLYVAPQWSDPVELLLLAIRPELLNSVAAQMNSRRAVELIPRFHFRDELLRQLSLQLIAEFEQGSSPDRFYVDSLKHTVLAHLIRNYSTNDVESVSGRHGLPQRRLNRVLDFIHSSLGETILVQDLATLAGMSPSHFLVMFRQSMKMSPHRYIMLRRLELAQELLQQSQLPIAEIARLSGFSDQSHLTRSMRRFMQITPGLIRSR